MQKKGFNDRISSPASVVRGCPEVVASSKCDSGGILCVGVDIAKHRHCARAIGGKGGKESKPFFFSNDKRGFENLIERMGGWLGQMDCSSVAFGMEPTAGYWEPLHDWLKRADYEVKLVSSLKVKRSKDMMDNSPLKSDEKDSLLIAKLLSEGNVLDFNGRANDDIEEVRTLFKLAQDLEKDIGQWEQHIEKHRSIHFPELAVEFPDLGSVTLRKLLREYPFPKDMIDAGLVRVEKTLWTASRGRYGPDKAKLLMKVAGDSVGVKRDNASVRFELTVILNQLESGVNDLAQTRKLLEEKLKCIPMHDIVTSVPGAGVMTSAAVISALGDLSKYRSASQVLKKAGLNLYRFSSGKHRGTDRISRRGSAELRKVLYMAAVGYCRQGSIFYGKYSSMTKRGMPKKKAIVAVMRKLLKLLFALVRDNRKFESHYSRPGAKRDVNVIKRAAA